MQKLNIEQTALTPRIRFSPEENIFLIRGTSSPEDVRALYYPVIDWVRNFTEEALQGRFKSFNALNPLRFQIDLNYFNSSSAKFFYDILIELNKLPPAGLPVNIEWYYNAEDTDMKEAGADISLLVGMEFTYIEKPSEN
jgi:hypothetical protein